jgi:hypothetical protein
MVATEHLSSGQHTQGAYNEQSNTQKGQFTNNDAEMTSSDSVKETGLPNAQNMKNEGVAAAKSTPNQAEKTGWGN